MIRALLTLGLLFGLAGVALADDGGDAKAHYERATSAFALGKFADAAVEYEKAFELKSDRALLYNAAQSHRMAGNKQRALLLYQNYLRIFTKAPNRAEVQRQIAELQKAIDTEPAPEPPPKLPEPTPVVTPAPTPAPTLAVEATPAPRKKPLYKKGWFWGVVAGSAVVVGGAIALGVVFGRSPHDPNASLGSIKVGN